MLATSRGQVFSLDLIVALTVTILGVGLLLQQFELLTYHQNAQVEQYYLNQVTQTASNRLVSLEEFTCKVQSTSGERLLNKVPNCWPQTSLINLSDSNLGIPDRYDYCVKLDGIEISGPCPSADIQNISAIDRQIVQLNTGSTLTKQELFACLSGSACRWTQKTVTLQVWKS